MTSARSSRPSNVVANAPSAQTLLALARARVYARLERAADFPVVVVCAPKGSGKSTVLREFFGARERSYRRLHVARGHGDLLDFMRTLATGLSDLAPALATSFMGVYDRVQRGEDAPGNIALWAAGYLESVAVTLVIDGLENASDERLLDVVGELIDRTVDAAIRWVLVGTSADRFPLARWLANDRMDLPLEDVDLALTFDDLAVAVDRSQAPITRPMLRKLCGVAGNWPAAIALALVNVAALATLPDETPRGDLYAYFAERAFEAHSEIERRFLLETCLYEYFDAALLVAAGWPHVESMLDGLRDAAVLLYFDGTAFRYHELFGAFLRERLRAEPNDRYARVRARVADVCRRVGRWSDALELYTDLQSAMPLAQLLSEHGFELVDRGEGGLVARGLAALGDAEFAAFPVALAVKASVESLHGNLDVAEAWFRHAIENTSDPGLRAAIVFRFATDLVRQDRREAIEVLEPIVAAGGHALALSISLAGLLATAYATHGQGDLAARTIEGALHQIVDVDDPAIRAKIFFQAGYVAFFAHDSVRAKRYAQAAVETALASYLYDIAARALSILYNVAMEYEDDVGAARGYLDRLAECSRRAGSRHLLVYATLGQFEIEVFRGNSHESARLNEALQSLDIDYSVFASETFLPAAALRATWNGDFHRAYRLIAPTAEQQITPARQSQRYAEIALYAAAAGLRTEAAVAVRQAFALASTGDSNDTSSAFAKTYVALALVVLGRHQRAAQVLRRLDRSKLTTRLRLFIRAIATINDRWARGTYSTDLRATLEGLYANDFGGIGRLIEALPLPETFRGRFAPLTPVECETLIHLSAALNIDEIAALSGRPVEMIDALVVSLCRKLGCSSARHAIALAMSADGILAPAMLSSALSANANDVLSPAGA